MEIQPSPRRERVCVSRSPSPDMSYLRLLKPDLFADNINTGLCRASTVNLVGSLLAYTKDELNASAIRIASDVPILIRDNQDINYHRTGIIADEMIIKYGVGQRGVGFVTAGDLTGLIVRERYNSEDPKDGMYAVRVFNDEVANHKSFYEFDSNLKRTYTQEEYHRFYHELIARIANHRDVNTVYLSELIADLMRQIGLPFEQDKFHYTRYTT